MNVIEQVVFSVFLIAAIVLLVVIAKATGLWPLWVPAAMLLYALWLTITLP